LYFSGARAICAHEIILWHLKDLDFTLYWSGSFAASAAGRSGRHANKED
jgi:hypothetical protein